MTLVASFSIDNHPILLGDLMLSRPRKDGVDYKSFTTPLHVDPNREVLGKQSDIVSGLSQKVNVLTPRLAVAWAGSERQARLALPRLRDDVADAGYTISSVEQSLAGLSKLHDDLYLTGIMTLAAHGPDIPMASFSWPNEKGKRFCSHIYGNVHVGGSGAKDFAQLVEMREGLEMKSDGQLNSHTKAIAEALAMAARLSGDQMRCGSGLQDFYGGGFEIATLIGETITKVGEIAYHLWEAGPTNGGQIRITPYAVQRYSYDADLLHIRNVQLVRAPTPYIDETYVLSPVHDPMTVAEKDKFVEDFTQLPLDSLDSKIEVIYLYIPLSNRTDVLMHYRGNAGEPSVRYREFEGGCDFVLSQKLRQRVDAAVQRAVAETP
jgi:hypothetical protein